MKKGYVTVRISKSDVKILKEYKTHPRQSYSELIENAVEFFARQKNIKINL